jgi:RsiW-degrading membrane proteinase PrsW (M82 family)
MTGMLLNALLAFLPVLTFLLILVLMDSFKLASPSLVARCLISGVLAALVCEPLYVVVAAHGVNATILSRYVAPVTEETAKALFVGWLIARRRVGFPVDAAQVGFAAGAGFALVENLQYLRVFSEASLVLWSVRGFGTAMLHGAATAIFAMLAQTASDRRPDQLWSVFAPAWAAAVVIHGVYNHVPLPPMAMTTLLLMTLPLLVLAVFQRSEQATRDWVGAGLDLDVELLSVFSSEDFVHTKFSDYLLELRQRFPGPVVADMLCLLRIELELSVQVKAMLMVRELGGAVPLHDDTQRALDERSYLRKSIGPTGLLALQPVQVTSHRDDWHRHVLAGERKLRFVRGGSRIAGAIRRRLGLASRRSARS